MEGQFWDSMETLSRDELKKLQLFRLKDTIRRAASSLFYRSKFKQHQITADALHSLEDIQHFPFTTRQDLSTHYPFGILSIERSEVVRFHSSTGAYAPKKGIFYSRDDLSSWASIVARSFNTAGLVTTDIMQVMTDFGLHPTSHGCELGGEELGLLVIPAGNISMHRHIQLMKELGTTVLYLPAGILPSLIDAFYELNLNPSVDTELRLLIVGESPLNEEEKKKYENILRIPIHRSYGILEINSPGMAIECEQQQGMHIWEDYYLIEIIDPQTLKNLPAGEWGELVITTLNQEAMPLIRYQTGDITRIIEEPCPCGRTHRRIDNTTRRSDELFFIQGRALYPSQIAETLKRVPEVGDNYVIYLDTVDNNDQLIVEVEVVDNLYLDNYGKLECLTKNISSRIFEETKIQPKIKLVQNNYFLEQNYKNLKQVVDRRKKV
ncbi:MAG TPA: AMP-binding protein [Bacteroidales bacterium]|mgnify:CR=1 FL=1|nr:AMP-binding protein [Bacteroidales bacterium]HPO66095.1 AMP-binding protein [Bacteroidales bacterium]